MKSPVFKKSLIKTAFSLFVLGVFIVLASGSLLITFFNWAAPAKKVENLEGRVVKTTYEDEDDDKKTEYIGTRDFDGNYYGKVAIIHYFHGCSDTTWVNYVDGKKHGEATRKYCYGESTTFCCYNMGNFEENTKSAQISASDTTAVQVIKNTFPLEFAALNTFGHESVYIESFLDTLESILYATEFDESEFEDAYSDVIEVLEETHFNDIIHTVSMLTFIEASEWLKTNEFRLAVMNSYRMENPNTFSIIQTKFPGYLEGMLSFDITENDFEGFCLDLDSIMTDYGPLNGEDPLYPDSVEIRLDRALFEILSVEDTTESNMSVLNEVYKPLETMSFKSAKKYIAPILRHVLLRPESQDIALMVVVLMYYEYGQADFIKSSVREAYFNKNSIVNIAEVTTEFSNHVTDNSVIINGYIISDGRDEISDKGIVWATFFNPTVNDNIESSRSGSEDFNVTINGLMPGTTYYARSYATNSVGTAYGNCIEFTAGSTVINELNKKEFNLKVYPNPVSGIANFKIDNFSSESINLKIIDLEGRVLLEYNSDMLSSGENRFQLDLSGLSEGVYNCILFDNKEIKAGCKIVVAH